MRKRRLTVGLFATLMFVQVFSVLMVFSGQASAQSTSITDPATDLRRRRLHTFAQCLTRDVIDEDDEIEDFGDLFDHNEDTRELTVVGFDRDGGNGVMTCDTVIRQGLQEFRPGVGNHQEWLLRELTGEEFDRDGGTLSNANIERNRQDLYDRIKTIERNLGSASDDLRRQRYLPLLELCYEMQEGGPTTRQIRQGRDFSIPGVGTFYHRDDLDDDSIAWLDQDESVSSNLVDLGDIQLEFYSRASVADRWNSFTSNFYPIGSDVPRETEGHYLDAIVSCEFVYDNRQLILEGTRVEGDQLVDTATGQPVDTSGAAPDAAADDTQPSCETEGAELSWVLCPVLFAMDKFIGGLDNAIQNMLVVPNSYITNANLRQAWANLRNIAYLVLVPIMLVMVIGTALGFEFFSAYTVKRALPRLIAATIFITLSWEIMKFLVILTNNVGLGVGGIIAAPFGGIDGITLASVMNPSYEDGAVAAGGVFGAAILTYPLLLANIPVILSLAFTTALGLLIGFVLLSFRQLLVMALALLAPLAILAWIFPGNDKLWKLWWGTFSKLLMLFPLIMILIAAGRALAQVSSEAEGSIVGTVIKVIAYIGPYFMIPAMFKFAGGLFASIAGMTNDKTRGIFDKQREKRQAKTAENMAKYKTGSLGGGRLGTIGNRFGANIGTGAAGGWGLRRSVANQRMDQLKEQRALSEVMKNPGWSSISQNDDALRAGTYDSAADARRGLRPHLQVRNDDGTVNEAATTQRVEDAIAAYRATGYKFGDRAAQIANARQLSSTGTGYENLDDQAEVLARVAHGSYGQASSLSGFVNFENKRAGRNDLAPGFGGVRESVVAAGGIGGAGRLTAERRQALQMAASGAVDTVSSLRGKTLQVRGNANNIQSVLETSVDALAEVEDQINSGQLQGQQLQIAQQTRATLQTRIKQTMGQINQYENNKSYASPENQHVVNDLVENTAQTRGRALELLTGTPVTYSGVTGEPELVNRPPTMTQEAQWHLADIERRSATPQRANNPNLQQPDNNPPPDPNNP